MNKLQSTLIFSAIILIFTGYFLAPNFKTTDQVPNKRHSGHKHNFKLDSLESIFLSSLVKPKRDSVAFYKELLNKENSHKAHLKVSAVYLGLGAYGLAAHYYIKAFTDSAKSINNILWLKELEQKEINEDFKHKINESIEDICLEIINKDSTNYNAMYELANLNIYNKGDVMSGVQLLLKISREKPDFLPAQYQLAVLAIRSAQYEKAIKRLTMLNSKQPKNIDILLNLGKAHHLNGEGDKAITYFNECKKLAKPEETDMINQFIKTIINA